MKKYLIAFVLCLFLGSLAHAGKIVDQEKMKKNLFEVFSSDHWIAETYFGYLKNFENREMSSGEVTNLISDANLVFFSSRAFLSSDQYHARYTVGQNIGKVIPAIFESAEKSEEEKEESLSFSNDYTESNSSFENL